MVDSFIGGFQDYRIQQDMFGYCEVLDSLDEAVALTKLWKNSPDMFWEKTNEFEKCLTEKTSPSCEMLNINGLV